MSIEKIPIFKLKSLFFGDRDPVTEPVWWLQICPACGKTMLTPPHVCCIHASKDHTAKYIVDSANITWKEARELVNVNDIIGLGLAIEKPDQTDWKIHRQFVKALDALAGVSMKGKDNYLDAKKQRGLEK